MGGLKWSTAGESHGQALVGVLEGLPAGLELSVGRIDGELARRQGGYGRGGRMRIESDRVEVLAGLRLGRTLGSPLGLLVRNQDSVIDDLGQPESPRPGHADLAGCQRMGVADARGVLERASARETAMRVALGAAARQVLELFGVTLFGHVVELGGEGVDVASGAALRDGSGGEAALELRGASDFACLDPGQEAAWRQRVDAAKQAGDTLGGVFEVVVVGLPAGLGSYFDGRERLTARLAGAVMSIPAVKGFEVGLGFEAARRVGSKVHDPIVPREQANWSVGDFGRASNRAGGLEGGLTTGAPLVLRAAMKPISTLKQGIDTVGFGGAGAKRSTYQRSDVTAVPAASVVAEAVVALELTAAFLDAFGGPTMEVTRERWESWRRRAESL